MVALTSALLNSASSSDVVTATPPNVVNVVQLWTPVVDGAGGGAGSGPSSGTDTAAGDGYTLTDEDLGDFLALLGSDAKRKRSDFKDGEEFDKVVKGIFSGEK